MSTRIRRLLPIRCAVGCVLLVMLCAPGADADDSSAGVMLPGLRSDPAGSVIVSAASLVSKPRQVELTLTIAVRRSQGTSVIIQMPRFGWLGEAEPYPDRQFPELKIVVDGAPAAMESSFAAFVGSVDVTEAIRKAGLDPFAISDTPPFVTSKAGGVSALEALERLGAIEKADGSYLAKWTAARKIKVALNAGSHTLTLTYESRPGYGLLRFNQISRPAYLARYCLTPQDVMSVFGRVAATRLFAVWEHSIPSSVDDRPPPSLSVAVMDVAAKEATARSLIAFCGADGKAVIGQAATVMTSARADAKGVVRFLSIGPANRSR